MFFGSIISNNFVTYSWPETKRLQNFYSKWMNRIEILLTPMNQSTLNFRLESVHRKSGPMKIQKLPIKSIHDDANSGYYLYVILCLFLSNIPSSVNVLIRMKKRGKERRNAINMNLLILLKLTFYSDDYIHWNTLSL